MLAGPHKRNRTAVPRYKSHALPSFVSVVQINLSSSLPPRADCMRVFNQPGALISATVLSSTGSGSGRGSASKKPCSVSAIGGGASSSSDAKSRLSAGAVCPFPNLMKSKIPSAIASAAHAALASSNVAYSTSTEHARNRCSESLICNAHPYSVFFNETSETPCWCGAHIRGGVTHCPLVCCR